MGETVGYPVCGIPAGVNGEGTLQFVVTSSVQKVADGNHTRHPSSEEDQLTHGPALAKRFCHGVHLCSSIAQVMVGDAKVDRFQRGVARKKGPVGCVPKTMLSWELRQILGAACTADEEQDQKKMEYSAPSHALNLRLNQ